MPRTVKKKRKRAAPRLFVYGVTVEEWTKRWGIEPFTTSCYACQRPCTTTRPFVQGTLVGLQAPVCECGHPAAPYVIMRNPKYGDLFTGGSGTLLE